MKKMMINVGKKNGNYNENCGINGLHRFIRRRKKQPCNCEVCNKQTIYLDLALVGKKYTRNPEDYQYICRSCHMKSDNRAEELHINLMRSIYIKNINSARKRCTKCGQFLGEKVTDCDWCAKHGNDWLLDSKEDYGD